MKKNAKREPVKVVRVDAVAGSGETQSTGEEDPGQMGSGG